MSESDKAKIKFSLKDENPYEIVRAAMFQTLHFEWLNQFPSDWSVFERVVDFDEDKVQTGQRFLLMAQEILWDLIIQRIVTPGLNPSNPNLPWFRLTEYGKNVIKHGESNPHDPSGYLEKITQVDPIAYEYIKESLRDFSVGCYLSSVMMLGIAAERIFLKLCDVLSISLAIASEKSQFELILSKNSMQAKFDFVRRKLETVSKQKSKDFPANFETSFLGISELIRFQRNDVGHPQDDLITPDRELVFIRLRMFPHYCEKIRELEIFLAKNKV